MKFGICEVCLKRGRIKCRNKCVNCYYREKNIESRKRKVENHKCLNCGKPVKKLKCPHCKKIVKYYRRCERCLKK